MDELLQTNRLMMLTLSDKKRAVEISHKIQQNISNYLFSVSLNNIGLGIVVSGRSKSFATRAVLSAMSELVTS